jgi:hypothetical protein
VRHLEDEVKEECRHAKRCRREGRNELNEQIEEFYEEVKEMSDRRKWMKSYRIRMMNILGNTNCRKNNMRRRREESCK